MDTVNFTANHIKNVEILKKCSDKYKPCEVALVELDACSQKDRNTVDGINRIWDYSFTAFTYDDMVKFSESNYLADRLHVYALTTQKGKYEKVTPKKILGIVELIEDTCSGNKIEVLQTKPTLLPDMKHPNPKYKHVGNQLISYLKDRHLNRQLYVNPTKTAVEFYKKQGFEWQPGFEYRNRMWIAPKNSPKK